MVELSVIVPAYNEEGIIAKTIEEIKNTLRDADIDYEIIVVDDGSEDSTYLVVKECFSKDPRIIVVRKENGGKGSAIKYGFKFTRGKYVGFIDADLEIHPRYIVKLLVELIDNNSDVAIGSKRVRGANFRYKNPLRRVLSRAYFLMVQTLFNLPVKDTQVGIKLFKRSVFEDVLKRVTCKRYAFDLELIVVTNLLGYKISEIPVVIEFRKKNRIKIKDIWKMLLDTLGIYYRARIIKYYKKCCNENSKLEKLTLEDKHDPLMGD